MGNKKDMVPLAPLCHAKEANAFMQPTHDYFSPDPAMKRMNILVLF